jgi:hypothetical protein
MTNGEQNLRAAVHEFAQSKGLEDHVRWTTTGLEIEFVEPLQRGKNRRFMRCTITPLEVRKCTGLTKTLLKAQWDLAWGRGGSKA